MSAYDEDRVSGNSRIRFSNSLIVLILLAVVAGMPWPVWAQEQGWFEVQRSVAVVSETAQPSQADISDTSALVANDPLSQAGWQAVPSIRHAALPEAVSSTNIGSANTAIRGEPLILTRGEIHELGSDSPARLVSTQPGNRRSNTPASATSSPSSPPPTAPPGLNESAAMTADQRQNLRNRIPSSAIKTLNIDMFAGQVKVLGKVDVERVAIGNGDIVRADVLKTGELLVIAEVEGSTSLRLWHKDGTQSDYNIRVSSSDPETRVRMERMVRMRVRMIEFRKSALGQLGIDWSDSAAGPGFAVAGDAVGNNLFRLPADGIDGALPNTVKPFSTYFGVASSITSRINFLASTGDAVTLAEPVLSTTNGGSASFLAGGEVPYPSVGANGQTVVQFKEYGIKLNVSPLIDAHGNVRTLVETEISQLDPAVSVQGAPGLLTRRAQTQVNVRSGETIVISGLLSSESSKDIDKLPGIGNLPVIGSFFRSRNARNAVSELVIFVTPEIVNPAQPLASDRHQAFLHSAEQRVQQARDTLELPE